MLAKRPFASEADYEEYLRDWFAGQALARLVSGDSVQLESWSEVAAASYDAADAMLAARTNGGQSNG